MVEGGWDPSSQEDEGRGLQIHGYPWSRIDLVPMEHFLKKALGTPPASCFLAAPSGVLFHFRVLLS